MAKSVFQLPKTTIGGIVKNVGGGFISKTWSRLKGAGIPSYNKPSPFEIDLSYHHLIAAIDRSLKRLQTDYVDLYHAHAAPQSESDFVNLEKAFGKIKSEGKASYCGVSIGLEYQKGIELINRGMVDSIQLYFSLLDFKS